MARRKLKQRPLPRAVTDRRPFLTGFIDLILEDGRIVVLSAPATTLVSRRFAEHAMKMIPDKAWVSFMLNDAVHVGVEQKAFLDVLMKVWPRAEDLDAELERVAMDLLHEFIKLVTTKAPGAITQIFKNIGIEFGPVPQ